ncbi:iron/manganese superoxide dismutase-1 [Elsinoe australis]|uniref:Superoxide dismutase n=1 Tax=Elsinoe australis TaxID=40998 RepID=A0A4U7BA94_9PEZI|nr:iron/manganese superoxide dismutase-1 [Elsinoe australis]
MATTQYTLPKLPYGYNALEPHISEQIMTLHHTQHHQTYVNSLNAALQSQATAFSAGKIAEQVHLQQLIKFHAGGHINHSLFWENLAPASSTTPSPTAESAPTLHAALVKHWSSVEAFKEAFEATLLGLQGSGWGWLVQDGKTGVLAIITTKDQDIPPKPYKPLLGVDMWEHAYYLQYQNKKKDYTKEIWHVINWKTVEGRISGKISTDFDQLSQQAGRL